MNEGAVTLAEDHERVHRPANVVDLLDPRVIPQLLT